MRRFIFKLTIFVILLLIFLQGFILERNPYLQQKTRYVSNITDYQKFKSPVLILGDSQPAAIPQEMLGGEIYNFAFGSDSLNEMSIKLRYALNVNPGIHTVLVSYDYHVLSKYRTSINNKLLIQSFTDPATYKELYHEAYPENPLSRFLSRSPYFEPNVYVFTRRKIFESIRNLFKRRSEKNIDASKNWVDIPPADRLDSAANRAKTLLQEISADLLDHYREMIALCHQHHIRVIAVRYPLSRDYLAVIKPYDLTAVDTALKSLAFDLILDYKDLLPDSQYYTNADHMNLAGIMIFLEKLTGDIKR